MKRDMLVTNYDTLDMGYSGENVKKWDVTMGYDNDKL